MAFPARAIESRRVIARGFFIGIALTLSVNAHAVTAPVGSTPGSFAVSAHGGATYAIPIAAPPGTAGLTPQISLSYDKQIRNDLVGVGWSIGGLSIITRCGTTIAIDGVKGGVYHDSRDRFCLDGQRLINVSGAYGANGTEYRTERESFHKIYSYGVAGNGPAFFKVTAPNGTESEYGATPDSRIEAAPKNGVPQTVVRLWVLNKVQDIKGNYFTITYDEDNANGEYRPTRIDYTGSVGTNGVRSHIPTTATIRTIHVKLPRLKNN